MTTLKKPKSKAKSKTAKPKKSTKAKSTRKAAKPARKASSKKVVKRSPPRKTAKKAAIKSSPKKSTAKKAAPKKTAAKKPAVAAKIITQPKPSYPPLVAGVLAQLEDAKAEQIVTIDLVNKSTIADTMIIASGRSNRHVNAIADQVAEKLHQMGQKNLRIEGVPQCDWVLVDSGDLVVHVFRPEVRSFYNLEKLWSAPAAG